jgi:hypothetical protein
MNRIYLSMTLCIALHCPYSQAEERLKLDKTTILGIGELPKVTFVVPWRDAPADIPEWELSPAARPLAIPLDSELYHRQVQYTRQIKKRDDGENHQ